MSRPAGSPTGPAAATLGGLVAALLGLPGAAAPETAGRHTPPPVAVGVDATNRVIGTVIGADFEFQATLFYRQGDHTGLLALQRDRLANLAHAVVFEGPGCLGPPFIAVFGAPQASVFGEAAVGPDNLLYGAAGPAVERPIKSVWRVNFDGPAECGATDTQLFTRQATLLEDLKTLSPPFRVIAP